MAASRVGNVIYFTANGDKVSSSLNVKAIITTGATTVKDGDGTNVLFKTAGAESVTFCGGFIFPDGLEMDSGTEMTVFLS